MKSSFVEGEGAHDVLFSPELWWNSMSHKAVMSQFYKLVLRKDGCSLPHSTHIYSNRVSRLKPLAL